MSHPESGPAAEVDAAAPRTNAILAALPDEELQRLQDQSELAEMDLRDSVYEPGGPITDVYFPLDAVFSMITVLGEQFSVEVGTVGFEGMVGLPAFLGSPSSPHAAFCQISGRALRVPVPALRDTLAGDGVLHDQLHQYTSATMVQLAQSVACNSAHDAERRAARWLLTTHDRVRRDEFPLTQDFLAQMLGVRRPTVSEIAQRLQDRGLISYTRGRMTIVDRALLENLSCECYWTVRRAFPAVEQASARLARASGRTRANDNDENAGSSATEQAGGRY
jgi:CRP-like cAMP-binding protein